MVIAIAVCGFVLALTLLIVSHELGHFLAAKLLGVRVEEFALGFPPRLFARRCGETTYALNLLPLGGYVRLEGEGEASTPRSFKSQKLWAQATIVLAGVLANLLLAWVLASANALYGQRIVLDGLPIDELPLRVIERSVTAMNVRPQSPAAAAGILPGDVLQRVDGKPIANADELISYLNAYTGSGEVVLGYERGGDALSTALLPERIGTGGDERYRLGIELATIGLVRHAWYRAPVVGAQTVWYMTREIFTTLGMWASQLASDRAPSAQVQGPLGIAVLSGQTLQLGLAYYLPFLILLSLNLAVLNALPIPALDGGRLLLIAVEWLRGKPLRPVLEATIHRIGFALLIGLVIFVTVRDIFTLDKIPTLF